MWEAPRRTPAQRLLTQKVKWNISFTVHFFFFFFNYKKAARKSSLMSQGGTLPSFCVFLHILPPLLFAVSFLSCFAQGSLITRLKEKDGLCNSYFNLCDPSKEAHWLIIACKIDFLHPFRAYSWKFTAQVHCLNSEGNKLIYGHVDQFRTWWRLGERITFSLPLKATL